MSAYTLRYVSCDRCGEKLYGAAGRGTGQGITEVRKRAKMRGWTHPDGWTDLCPRCKGQEK